MSKFINLAITELPSGHFTLIQLFYSLFNELRIVEIEPGTKDCDLLNGISVEVSADMFQPYPTLRGLRLWRGRWRRRRGGGFCFGRV